MEHVNIEDILKKENELIQNLDGKQGYLKLNSLEELKNILQTEPAKEWNNYDVVLQSI